MIRLGYVFLRGSRKKDGGNCEMVGTGPKGHVSFLAGCSTVNYHGDVLYDEYILPPCYIVDYWTRWSSIWKHHMLNATPFKIPASPSACVSAPLCIYHE
uniref:Uncharacterized protein n=1 Tax=Canis lupus dingo TaxID=286419 RepID=A0A8C0K4X2_CANLU